MLVIAGELVPARRGFYPEQSPEPLRSHCKEGSAHVGLHIFVGCFLAVFRGGGRFQESVGHSSHRPDRDAVAGQRFSRHRSISRPASPLCRRLIVVEATGGYERPLVKGLLDAGLPVVRVNPLHVRRFAQSRGILAKTDRLDARVLADFGRLNADRLRPMRPISDNARMLQELTTRRRQLVEQCVANKSQREHATLASRAQIDRSHDQAPVPARSPSSRRRSSA